MGKFLSPRLKGLKPYTPGEQPQGGKYIKLNTNESPFPPSPYVFKALEGQAETLRLYPDPENRLLNEAIAENFGLSPENIIAGNGSDELLALIFQAFCPKGAAFADITYGFYKVWAEFYGIDYKIVTLKDDFTLCLEDYRDLDETIVIANPNAPTGLAVSPEKIAALAAEKPERIIVVDEAYVDFGAESCIRLVKELKNLIVVQTFSKSRSLAGGRAAFAAGDAELIRDFNTVKFSFHPYNLDRLTQLAAAAAIKDRVYFETCTSKIIKTRERVSGELKTLGFFLTDSMTNFIFARHEKIPGAEFYRLLKEKGVLVRYFGTERIEDFIRITVGSDDEMDAFLKALKDILKEAAK